jgi:mRNA-degrading endonuclease RelE of RelBE toxin-antitoxin system
MSEQKLRQIFQSKEFEVFLDTLDARIRDKYLWTIKAVEILPFIPTKYVKKLETVDLYEMRVSIGYNEYRTVLFAMDSANVITATKIYLLNSFLKKSSKDYRREIERAQKMLEEIL